LSSSSRSCPRRSLLSRLQLAPAALPRSHPASAFLLTDTAPTEIYTLSLHDALPIYHGQVLHQPADRRHGDLHPHGDPRRRGDGRSEEHTSELQSPDHLVCRLLLEKKKAE